MAPSKLHGTSAYYSRILMAGFCYILRLALDLAMFKCCCKLYADVPTSILAAFCTRLFVDFVHFVHSYRSLDVLFTLLTLAK